MLPSKAKQKIMTKTRLFRTHKKNQSKNCKLEIRTKKIEFFKDFSSEIIQIKNCRQMKSSLTGEKNVSFVSFILSSWQGSTHYTQWCACCSAQEGKSMRMTAQLLTGKWNCQEPRRWRIEIHSIRKIRIKTLQLFKLKFIDSFSKIFNKNSEFILVDFWLNFLLNFKEKFVKTFWAKCPKFVSSLQPWYGLCVK